MWLIFMRLWIILDTRPEFTSRPCHLVGHCFAPSRSADCGSAVSLSNLKQMPLLPLGDPKLAEAIGTMSTESHNPGQEPRHTDVSFEERDIKAGTIMGIFFALALAVVASFLICVYILRFTLKFAASSDTPPPPSREALARISSAAPEPRWVSPAMKPIRRPISQERIRKTPRPMKSWSGSTSPAVSRRFRQGCDEILAEKGLSARAFAPEKKK